MNRVKNYLSLVKFAHTIFAMPFALIGFFIGIRSLPAFQGSSDDTQKLSGVYENTGMFFRENWWIFLLVLGCMVFSRSAAMAFNRWLDANYDKKNPRTAKREIPAGIIKPGNALWFVILNCIAFVTCCWFINRICFYLSFVALFVVLFYSYTKRFTALCHLVLGVGLSLAPIGAYLAVTGHFALLPILFSLAVLCWVSGFDIIYAMQDIEFDKELQLHSIPAAMGRKSALRVSVCLHGMAAACVIYAGWAGHFGALYWIGVSFFIGLLIYQHLLVKPHDLSKVNIAFFTTNGIASVIFAGFVILDMFLN